MNENISNNKSNTDSLYQVSLLQSLTLGEYDGVITTEELKKHGDTGIGTFQGVDGEMILLDGIVYQALANGKVIVEPRDETSPFAVVGFFKTDYIEKDCLYDNINELKKGLDAIVNNVGKNQLYIVKAYGKIRKIFVRSVLKQEKPYKTLDEALKTDQKEFEYYDTSGTIIGFFSPDYMDKVNASGWHFHFISDDKLKGGHLISLSDFEGEIEVSKKSLFEMILPDRNTFNQKDLNQNQEERIRKVEQN